MVTGVVRLKRTAGVPILDRLKVLARTDVLVGIPAENSTRPQVGEKINNAELLYILSHGVRKKGMRDAMQANINTGLSYSAAYSLYVMAHGSPIWHSPPRPVLEPAIAANRGVLSLRLKAAAQTALQNRPGDAMRELKMAGMMGADFAKGWFEDPRNNWPPNKPSTIRQKGSDSPMIDTGEMRKAITYVIAEKGAR